jgi:hypothetical protein
LGRTLENYMDEIPQASGALDQTDGVLCLEDDTIKMAVPPQINNAALWLPGSSGNYVSAPDAAALDITGDICFVARVAFDDWTPAGNAIIVGKWTTSYAFLLLTTGALSFSANTAAFSATSTVATGVTNGAWKWVAATIDVDNGAGGSTGRFWTADDGETWTQLGADVVGATVAIAAGTEVIEIGGHTSGTSDRMAGRVGNVSIRTGIGAAGIVGGTEVLNYNGDLARGQRYRDSYGNLFTHTGSAWALMAT